MANKREGLPAARSVKGLHPVEALVGETSESTTSNESILPAAAPTHTKGAASKERVVRETRKAPVIPSASATSKASIQVAASTDEDVDDEGDFRPPDAPTVGHYRRSFMLDPATIEVIDELRWKLRCDKSEVVRRAIECLADEEKIPFPID